MGTLRSSPAWLHGGPCSRTAAKPGPEPGRCHHLLGTLSPGGGRGRLRGRVGQTSPVEGLLSAEQFLSVTWGCGAGPEEGRGRRGR